MAFEAVDVAFGETGAVGQGEPGGDGGQVLADPGGEGMQLGLVIGVDALEPAGKVLFSGAFGHHLGEAGHVLGQAVELGTVPAQVGQELLLAGVEVVGLA